MATARSTCYSRRTHAGWRRRRSIAGRTGRSRVSRTGRGGSAVGAAIFIQPPLLLLLLLLLLLSPSFATRTVGELSPFTRYRLRSVVFNSVGSAASPELEFRTLETVPDGLPAPIVNILRIDVIEVSWTQPVQPNGHILWYKLYRQVQQNSGAYRQ